MSKDMIIILSLALIVVAGWISLDTFRAVTRTRPPVATEEMLRPLVPNPDFEVLKDLRARVDNTE